MWWIVGGGILFLAFWSFGMKWAVSDNFYLMAKKLTGSKIITVSAGKIDGSFRTILLTDPWGQNYAYRYPDAKVGYIHLNPDGTGDYYGDIKWIREK